MKRLCIFILLLIVHCISKDINEEVIYDDPSLVGYYSLKNPKNKDFQESLKQIEEKAVSFKGEFSMKIQSGENLKNTDRVNGKIFYSKEKTKMKIQLLDPFFGLVLAQIVSDDDSIKIKPMGKDKITEQPMGDINIIDPTTKRVIAIPYHVIYNTIRWNFSKVFSLGDTRLNPTEKKVVVRKQTEEFKYEFYEGGITSLEYKSIPKNLQAKCKVAQTALDGSYPPKAMTNKVTDLVSGKDTSYVEIQYKNISKNSKFTDSDFTIQ
ncbi:MAG: hypothetical protein SFU98_03355 [Leptospiraceae bacterium]|nr:hypothetical protein [Leptospiraceae bacterium]